MHDNLIPGAVYVGTPYAEMNCWQLVLQVYQDIFGRDQCLTVARTINDLCEVWYEGDCEPHIEAHDLLLFALRGHASHHVGIAISADRILHSTRENGVVIDSIGSYKPFLLQVARHKLRLHGILPQPTFPAPLAHDPDHVTLRQIRTPIPGPTGTPHEIRAAVEPGMLHAMLPALHDDELRQVYVNGRLIDEMTSLLLVSGDEVLTLPTWQGPGQLIGAGISLALGIGFSLLSSVLNKPESTNQLATDAERSFTFAGAQSRYTPGGRVPILYGRRRVGVDLGAGVQTVRYASTFLDTAGTGSDRTRTVLDHFQQSFNVLGKVTVLRVSISGQGGNLQPRVGQRIQLAPGTSGQGRAKGEYRIASVDYRFFNQVDIGINHLRHFNPPALVDAEVTLLNSFEFNATSENASLDVLGIIAQGPVSLIHQSTIELNGQPLDNFPEVDIEVRNGYTPQAPLRGIENAGLTVGIGQDLQTSPAVSYTTTAPIDRFRLNIDFNQGLIKFTNEGSTQDNRVTIEYRYQRKSEAFTPWRQVTFVAKSLSPVRVSVERSGLDEDYYTIETRLVSAEQDDPAKGRFTATLTSITEIRSETVRYDGFALLWIKNIPADRVEGQMPNITVVVDGTPCRVGGFNNAPRFTDNPAWCVMDMLGRVFGVPDSKIQLAAFRTYGAVCDQLVDSSRRDEQLSGSVPSVLPAIDPLDEIVGKRRKHRLSYLLEAQTREQTIIQEMMEASRTELIREAGQWKPVPLLDDTPTQLFNMGNVSNVRVRYTKDVDQINVVEASYNDEDNNYERTSIAYPPVGTQPTIQRRASVDPRGVSTYDEALAVAQFELKQRQGPTRQLSFSTSLEGFRLQPYDLINFSHDLPGWGDSGRVATGANTTTHVVLDRPVNITVGTAYSLYCRFPNDETEIRAVINPGTGTYTELDVSVAFSQIPTPDTTLWSFGESSPAAAVVPFRLIEAPVYDETTGKMDVVAIWHNSNLYTDDPPTAPPPITQLPNFQGLPPEITDIDVTEFLRVDQTGARVATAWVSWTVDRLEVGESPYRGAIVQRRRVTTTASAGTGRVGEARIGTLILDNEITATTDFETLAEVHDGARQYDDQKVFPGETYQYRVIPVSVRGVWSLTRAAYYVHHVTGTDQGDDGTRPETPANLRLANQPVGNLNFEGPDIIFEWDRPLQDSAAKNTNLVNEWQVQIWGTSGANNFAYLLYPGLNQPAVLTRQTRFEFLQGINAEAAAQLNLEPQRKVTARVWARNQLQNQSFVPAEITVNNAAPDMSSLTAAFTPAIGGLIINWSSFVAPRDMAGYRVLVDTMNPPRMANSLYDNTVGPTVREVTVSGLSPIPHYVSITPLDTFGPGIATAIASATPITTATLEAVFVADDSLQVVNAETIIAALEIVVRPELGSIALQAKSVAQLAGGEGVTLRLREDNVTGTLLDTSLAFNTDAPGQTQSVAMTIPLFGGGPVTVPGSKFYVLTGEGFSSAGVNGPVNMTNSKIVGQYFFRTTANIGS